MTGWSDARSRTGTEACPTASLRAGWLDYAQWQRSDVLHLRAQVDALAARLARDGRPITRHYLPERDLLLLVSWDRGVGDYVRLRSRDEFLRQHPQETALADYWTWRSKRVEFTGISLAPDGPARGGLFAARALSSLDALRHRCQLGGGYLVWLDDTFLDHLHSLGLFDRRLEIQNRGPRKPGTPAGFSFPQRTALAAFDRALEELNRGR